MDLADPTFFAQFCLAADGGARRRRRALPAGVRRAGRGAAAAARALAPRLPPPGFRRFPLDSEANMNETLSIYLGAAGYR